MEIFGGEVFIAISKWFGHVHEFCLVNCTYAGILLIGVAIATGICIIHAQVV